MLPILRKFFFVAGSVIEFSKVIPMLTTPRPDSDFVFEVIAPSIPGYGWSSPAHKKGLNIPQVNKILNQYFFGFELHIMSFPCQVGRIFKILMTERLGFETFYAQGGDWGSGITTAIATLYPQK